MVQGDKINEFTILRPPSHHLMAASAILFITRTEGSMATYVETITERRVAPRRALVVPREHIAFLVPLGRALFAAIFILGSFGHFTSVYITAAAQAGVPMPNIVVPFAGIMALLGGLSILLGYHARLGAWVLMAFLIPTTFAMHNFWAVTDPLMRAMQQANFMKNLALIGTALLLAYWGAGPKSLDWMLKTRG
jgi:putative oxidoreductase